MRKKQTIPVKPDEPIVIGSVLKAMWCVHCQKNTHDSVDCWSTHAIDPSVQVDATIAFPGAEPPFKKKDSSA